MNIGKLYVQSTWRGFWAVVDNPQVITSCLGCSASNNVIIVLNRVDWDGQQWNPIGSPRYWLKNEWDNVLALTGDEPWRFYELSSQSVSQALDDGRHIDDIRGFRNRLERWQPVSQTSTEQDRVYVDATIARCWMRTDGWRVIKNPNNQWVSDGQMCNADPSILEQYPDFFDEISVNPVFNNRVDVQDIVDRYRPWE